VLASSITGIETGRVKDVTITGLDVTGMGGVAARDLAVPEVPTKYPEADMFGELPALALYARHVDGLALRDINVHSEEPDGRPAFVLEDVARLQLTGFDSTNIPPHQPILLFQNVSGALLYGNRVSGTADLFLRVSGAKSDRISLRGNDLRLAKQPFQRTSEVPRTAVSVEESSATVE
jgi:hypothetical protein